MEAYRDAEGNLIQYRYDANGNLTDLVYPDSRTVRYFYDSLNRLTNVTDWASRQTTFTYDLASRLTGIVRPNGTRRILKHDAAGQTTNIVEETASGSVIAFFKLNWNAAARVEWEFAAPMPHAWTPPTRSMTFDDDNRLETFNGQTVVHDPDGNMTFGPVAGGTFGSYTYDARNRLLGAGGLDYGYDPLGQRTSLTNGATVTRFIVNPNATLSQALVRVKDGVPTYYVYGLGLLYEEAEAGNTRTYHYDYRGSTVATTDGNGTVTDRIEYSAYGTTTYRTGSTDTPFLFNGQYGVQTDPNGLLHMRARYYNPNLCRFINADPIAFAGGLNFYAFAGGNPVSGFDPSGLFETGMFIRGLVGAVVSGTGAVIGYAAATTGVGTVPGIAVGVYSSYQLGANIGNMINAFSDTGAGPAGPIEAITTLTTANSNAQSGAVIADLAIPLVLSFGASPQWSRLPSTALGRPGTVGGIVQRAPNDPNVVYPILQAFQYADAALTVYEGWKWAGPFVQEALAKSAPDK